MRDQTNLPRWFSKPKFWLLVFILLNLAIGALIAQDYGESTDEAFERERARVALRMYSFEEFDREQAYLSLGIKRVYGTAQTALFEFVAQKLRPLLHVPYRTIIHFSYFITFQIAVLAIFHLTRHFTNDWVALAASVIFGTQPLIFGHAFINPKDIPQMAIFSATVAVGFHLSERLAAAVTPPPLPVEIWQAAIRDRDKWWKTFKSTRWLLLAGVFLGIFRLTAKIIVPPLVTWLYQAPPNSLGEKLFSLLGDSAGAIPLSDYINKGQVVAVRLGTYALIGWLMLYLAVFCWRLLSEGNARKPQRADWRSFVSGVQSEVKAIPAGIRWLAVIAGAVWGLAIATRVTGLAAGGIVGLCLLLEYRQKAIFPLLLYTLAAAVVCYAAWPFLWVFGLDGLLESLKAISTRAWGNTVLYNGELFASTELPRYYLLKMISLQLTIPVLFLSLGGFFLGIAALKKGSFSRTKFWLMAAWFALPVVYMLLKPSAQYNNFRQYLFVLPPLFVFTGLFLEWARTRLRWKPILPLVTLLFILPSIISIVQLHPYQYIYYNAFAGGTQGAFREYPLDYWLTSYQEVAEWVDDNVPPGSRILVWGGERRILPFVKNEYVYINPLHTDPDDTTLFDYIIITTEELLDLQYHTTADTIFSIERDHVPLVFVKEN